MRGSAPPWEASVTISSVDSTASLRAPISESAPATMGAESRSPRLETVSSVRGVSSRSSAVPLQSSSPSRKMLSRRAANRWRSSGFEINAASAASCCLRRVAKIASACACSPASDRVAASISWFVTPLIAETTATIGPSRAASFTICATRAIHAASPTDVPPNFITRKCFFILIGGSGAKRFEVARSEKRPGVQDGRASKNYTPSGGIRAMPVPRGCCMRRKGSCLALRFERRDHRRSLGRAKPSNVVIPGRSGA